MKKRIEDTARKVERVSSERHLNLNRLMWNHFCDKDQKPEKKGKSKKKK